MFRFLLGMIVGAYLCIQYQEPIKQWSAKAQEIIASWSNSSYSSH